MFRRFIALFAFVPVFAFAATWTGSQNGGSYSDPSSCLAEQKASWDRSWPDFVSCRTWSDTGWSKNGATQSVGSSLGGCAGGGVWCTAPLSTGNDTNDVCSKKVGQTEIVNVTAGWSRGVEDSSDWVYTYFLPPGGVAKVCGENLCEQTIDASEPCPECKAFVSAVPAANGLHRQSIDFRGHFTGKTCASVDSSDLPTEATARDDSKDPPCPGYVGEVNGKKGCFGTADKPIKPSPRPPKPSGITDTDTGNPAAGAKPSSGEGSGTGGSGRSPSTGTGGSAGGPAAAAGSGTKPDGTTPKPDDGKEQAHCGAPGQPKCGIDESGTPTKFDGKGDLLGGWEEGVKTNRATIEKSGAGIFESFDVFFSAPPLAGCEPIELPSDQVITRHCDVVEGTRSVMAYIWALTALWLCVGWIREAI